MRYFREHSKLISRLLINQVGMTIFGMILTLAVMRSTSNNTAIVVAVSIFSILFYLCLIYNVMWDEGARNGIRVSSGRMEKIPFFALKASLFAAVPNLVLAFLLLLCYILAFPFGMELARSAYAVLHIILALFEAMYVGLFSAILGAFPELATQSLHLLCNIFIRNDSHRLLFKMCPVIGYPKKSPARW